MRKYHAVIGERVLLVQGRNVWEAAERAAIHYSSRWLEGLRFFRGEVEMALWRPGMDAPVFVGDLSKWTAVFTTQGRSVVRWERLSRKAAA